MITKVTVGSATRQVVVVDIKDSFICGYLGRVWFMWNTAHYKLPGLRGWREFTGEERVLARRFLEPVIQELQDGKKTPMHLGAEKGGDSGKNTPPDGYISGVPKWIRERYKDWVECYCRETKEFLYYRRARIKPEYKEYVEAWLVYCSGCIYRAICEGPCDAPEHFSSELILRPSHEGAQNY